MITSSRPCSCEISGRFIESLMTKFRHSESELWSRSLPQYLSLLSLLDLSPHKRNPSEDDVVESYFALCDCNLDKLNVFKGTNWPSLMSIMVGDGICHVKSARTMNVMQDVDSRSECVMLSAYSSINRLHSPNSSTTLLGYKDFRSYVEFHWMLYHNLTKTGISTVPKYCAVHGINSMHSSDINS